MLAYNPSKKENVFIGLRLASFTLPIAVVRSAINAIRLAASNREADEKYAPQAST